MPGLLIKPSPRDDKAGRSGRASVASCSGTHESSVGCPCRNAGGATWATTRATCRPGMTICSFARAAGVDSFEHLFDTEPMVAPSSDLTAALATLRSRWGAAAPGFAGEVVGALATVPLETPDF